jgi:hypothetical protein
MLDLTMVANDLNRSVYNYPVPKSLEKIMNDKDVKLYLRQNYQRQLVLNVLGNIKLNKGYSEEQVQKLIDLAKTADGIDLMENHILFCVASQS